MIDRRRMLLAGATAAFNFIAPPSWGGSGFPSHRWVKILFVPTGERFNKLYFSDGAYILPAVEQFSWTCRDYRANEWKRFHPWLLDLIFVLHWKYNKDEIRILSGYRTPETNTLPVNPQQFERGEPNLQHERAMALDIQVPDVDNEAVAREFATYIYGGGGVYPHRDFFHADFGPNRHWVGRPPGRVHEWSASGFAVSHQGHIVTNAHVAKDCPSLTITHDGKEIPVKRILAIDKRTDLALLTTGQDWETAPVLSRDGVQTGDSIFALGFPYRSVLSSEPKFTTGIVNARTGIRGDSTEFQMSAQVQPGNSGGPVLDESGKIVGVVVGKLSPRVAGDVPENVNFAVSLDSLKDFLKTHRIEFTESAEQVSRKPRDIATSARQYTVAIALRSYKGSDRTAAPSSAPQPRDHIRAACPRRPPGPSPDKPNEPARPRPQAPTGTSLLPQPASIRGKSSGLRHRA